MNTYRNMVEDKLHRELVCARKTQAVATRAILEILGELDRRKGELMEQQWETVTVRADEIRVGDRLYGHVVAKVAEFKHWCIPAYSFSDAEASIIASIPTLAVVVVERPIKTITITVELTPDEAKTLADVYQHVEPCYPSGKVVKRFADACAEAVQKAQTP